MKQWTPACLDTDKPRYLEIADIIKADIAQGVLSPGDRLPSQRKIAQELGIDFSTVSRGFAEAVRRGLIETHVGRGTFVRESQGQMDQPDPRRALEADPMMNMPPEPSDPALLKLMQQGVQKLSVDLVSLLRYQSVTGAAQDRVIAARWMVDNGLQTDTERLVITSGSQISLYAILTLLTRPGSTVLCEEVTYPGLRSVAAKLGIRLIGLECDSKGITPDALEKAITDHQPDALYLNPTLQNPTTLTIPENRRHEIAKVLRDHELPLIEDDAYCFLAADMPPTISSLAPDTSWHIAGISKCFGAGLRLAFTTAPTQRMVGPFSQTLRSMHVMPSPITLALLGHWISNGSAGQIQHKIRAETQKRQQLAQDILGGCFVKSAPHAFNLWLSLPRGTSRAEIMARMSNSKIGILPSDAFSVGSQPEEALRVCLGGPISEEDLRTDLNALHDAVTRKDWLG